MRAGLKLLSRHAWAAAIECVGIPCDFNAVIRLFATPNARAIADCVGGTESIMFTFQKKMWLAFSRARFAPCVDL